MNICLFLSGFALGVFSNLFANLFTNLFTNYFKQILNLIYNKSKPKTKSKFLKINFICKITDKQLFDEYFPKFRNKSAPRTQPYWNYNEGVIKFEIDKQIDNPISFEYLLEDLDLPLFESFGKIYLFIDYNNLINIYLPESTINLTDFDKRETELSKKYNNLICATFKCKTSDIYITSYFKKFFNNTIDLTPELLLLGYDKNIKQFNNLILIDKYENFSFKLNEKINFF